LLPSPERSAGAADLRLVACAPTPGLRQAVFGGDDDLDEGGLRAAQRLAAVDGGRAPLGRADQWLAAPSSAALGTARAAGHEPTVEAALADCGYGRWEGRPAAEVAAAQPEALHAWLSDPASAPHGGESLVDVAARVGSWMDAVVGDDRRVAAFVPAVVVRAAVAHALGLPPAAYRKIDVSPLSVTRLRSRSGAWTLLLPPF
jgi:broad specificity phosphatase PhoE